MANEVKWLVPHRVAYFSMESDISSSEFMRINDELGILIEAGQAPVHLIADIQRMSRAPLDIQWIARKTAIRDEKVGMVVVIGANSLLKFMAQMVKSLTKSKIQMFDKLEDGMTFLKEEEPTLFAAVQE